MFLKTVNSTTKRLRQFSKKTEGLWNGLHVSRHGTSGGSMLNFKGREGNRWVIWGAFHLLQTLRNFHAERGPSNEECVPFDTSSILWCSSPKFKMVTQISPWPKPGTGDSLRKLVNGTCFSTGKFPRGKKDYFYKIPLIPGNFSVERT